MTTSYPIRFAAQLRQHLKAFRKARNLTQAQLGDLVGVSQARVAEIEANPGLVKFEQLMQLLSALEVTLSLHEDQVQWPAPEFSTKKLTASDNIESTYTPDPSDKSSSDINDEQTVKDGLPGHSKKGTW